MSETLDETVTTGLTKAATAYAKIIRKKPRELIDLALAAFNPALPPQSELLGAPEVLLYDKAPAVSSRFKDRPVALIRAVIILSLHDLLEDLQLGSLLYLGLVDTLHAYTDGSEQALRTGFLEKARATYLTAAQTAWDAPIDVSASGKKATSKAGTSKVQYSATDADELNKEIAAAVRNGQQMTAGYQYHEPWVTAFTLALANTIAEAINSSASSITTSINTSLAKTIATLEARLADAQETQEQQRRQERQADILWWLQVKYSSAQERPYRELDVATGAAQLALDVQEFIPKPVPPYVEAVVSEAVRSAYPDADTPQPLWDTLQSLTQLHALPPMHATRTLWAWAGRTEPASNFELATGLRGDTPVTPVALALWLFRQAQAERLM
ncbi:GTPase-associated system all-helical protein GASH [Deinococcus saxicola]|uniref:GTPase-associated system all-helical protein GASH n=1 Tax=Deinococcus saxicola TaxID=249406 RepID=UPI0039EF4F8F